MKEATPRMLPSFAPNGSQSGCSVIQPKLGGSNDGGMTPITVNDRPSIEIARPTIVWIAAEAAAPERVAEDDDVGAAVRFVGVGEVSTERGMGAEQAEVRRRHLRAGDSLDWSAVERQRNRRHRGHRAE